MFIGMRSADSKEALAVILTDYYKSALLLYNMNLIGSELLLEEDFPKILNSIKNTITAKEIFEVISIVDFVNFFINIESKLNKKIDSLEEIKALLPNTNLILFSSQEKRTYKIIFKKYPAVSSLYYLLLKLKETMLDLEDILESVNLQENLDSFIEVLNDYSLREFLVDFEKLGTEYLEKKISAGLLSENETDFCTFSPYQSGGICSLTKGYLSYINYVENRNQPIGSLSLLSHYIYFLKYGDDAENEREKKKILKLENKTNLDKLLFINGMSNERLNNFLIEVANQNFSNNLIIEKGNEILNILVKNNSFFKNDENNNIFAIYMLYKIKEKIEASKNQIREEILNIMEKKIKLEYRLVELELYIKKVISEFMGHKKIVSKVDEMETVFYDGIKKSFEDEISIIFNSLIKTKESEVN